MFKIVVSLFLCTPPYRLYLHILEGEYD